MAIKNLQTGKIVVGGFATMSEAVDTIIDGMPHDLYSYLVSDDETGDDICIVYNGVVWYPNNPQL